MKIIIPVVAVGIAVVVLSSSTVTKEKKPDVKDSMTMSQKWLFKKTIDTIDDRSYENDSINNGDLDDMAPKGDPPIKDRTRW